MITELAGLGAYFSPPNSANGKPVNHPANLGPAYRFAAELLDVLLEQLATQLGENFRRGFGKLGADVRRL